MTRVILNSPRCGHTFNDKGQMTGVFAQADGDEVEMKDDEAQRYIAKGLARAVKPNTKG